MEEESILNEMVGIWSNHDVGSVNVERSKIGDGVEGKGDAGPWVRGHGEFLVA